MTKPPVDLSTALHSSQPKAAEFGGSSQERRQLLVKLPPEQVRELKRLAADLDTTMQSLVSEALAMMLARYGRQ